MTDTSEQAAAWIKVISQEDADKQVADGDTPNWYCVAIRMSDGTVLRPIGVRVPEVLPQNVVFNRELGTCWDTTERTVCVFSQGGDQMRAGYRMAVLDWLMRRNGSVELTSKNIDYELAMRVHGIADRMGIAP